MYEYKCSNEACEHVWTIKEGDINSMYLTCPVCKKGRGQFVRQIKADLIHEDIQKIPLRTAENDFVESPNELVEQPEIVQQSPVEEIEKEETDISESEVKVEKIEIKPEEPKEENVESAPKIEQMQVEMKDIAKNIEEEHEEEDIFTRIMRKRKMEEELRRSCEDEDTDILEISGNTLEEIDNRIKEFEEYYYINVLDKNIQQQGKRYNCIIKYCRK